MATRLKPPCDPIQLGKLIVDIEPQGTSRMRNLVGRNEIAVDPARKVAQRGLSPTKRRNVQFAKAAPNEAGDIWTWAAIDAETELIQSWRVGDPGRRDCDRVSSVTYRNGSRIALAR